MQGTSVIWEILRMLSANTKSVSPTALTNPYPFLSVIGTTKIFRCRQCQNIRNLNRYAYW